MTVPKPTVITLLALFAGSVLTILAIAAITFSTDGGGFYGSELLVGVGFAAAGLALICPVLLAVLAVAQLRSSGTRLDSSRGTTTSAWGDSSLNTQVR